MDLQLEQNSYLPHCALSKEENCHLVSRLLQYQASKNSSRSPQHIVLVKPAQELGQVNHHVLVCP